MIECIPEAIYDIPTLPFIGLVIGILFAVNEAVRTKFRKASLKIEASGGTIVFDNRYIVTACMGVCVVIMTVASIKDAGLLNPVPNDGMGLVIALIAGFTEGWAVIRALNSRLDVFIKEKASKEPGKATDAVKAIEFIEVEDRKEEPKPTFEEL